MVQGCRRRSRRGLVIPFANAACDASMRPSSSAIRLRKAGMLSSCTPPRRPRVAWRRLPTCWVGCWRAGCRHFAFLEAGRTLFVVAVSVLMVLHVHDDRVDFACGFLAVSGVPLSRLCAAFCVFAGGWQSSAVLKSCGTKGWHDLRGSGSGGSFGKTSEADRSLIGDASRRCTGCVAQSKVEHGQSRRLRTVDVGSRRRAGLALGLGGRVADPRLVYCLARPRRASGDLRAGDLLGLPQQRVVGLVEVVPGRCPCRRSGTRGRRVCERRCRGLGRRAGGPRSRQGPPIASRYVHRPSAVSHLPSPRRASSLLRSGVGSYCALVKPPALRTSPSEMQSRRHALGVPTSFGQARAATLVLASLVGGSLDICECTLRIGSPLFSEYLLVPLRRGRAASSLALAGLDLLASQTWPRRLLARGCAARPARPVSARQSPHLRW